MEKFIMLECNRITQNSNIDEETDLYKNTWTNNVSNYGIEVKKGDVISLESASINTVGSIENTIEFVGSDEITEGEAIDNKCKLVMGQYINHTGQFTARLPFSGSRTYVSYDNPTQASKFNFFRYSRNRGLGEYDLSNYNQVAPREDYEDEERLPKGSYFFSLTINASGAGYRIGDICTLTDPLNQVGSGMEIMVTDILDEGTIQGAVSRVKMNNAGDYNYVVGATLNIVPPTQRQGFVQATLVLNLTNNQHLTETFTEGADGMRYYPASKNFTGTTMIDYVGSSATDENTAPFRDLPELNTEFRIRSLDLDLEIPVGLNQPEDIAESLTKQMKTPSQFNTYTKPESEHFNYLKAQNIVDFDLRNLPIIETNANKLNASNFSNLSQVRQSGSLAGARRLFYSNIAYRDPFKIEALGFSNSLKFSTEAVGQKDDFNDINTGKSQINNIGDFNNQRVGNLGIHMSLMSAFTGLNNLVDIERNELILTNMYFTEDTIKKISYGFRRIERYFGDMSNTVDTKSDDFNKYLTCFLDIGRYCDEVSDSTFGNPQQGAQRVRFATGIESTTDFTDTILRVVDTTASCLGTQPDFITGEFDNDGHQLSSLPVRSRFDEEILFENNNQYGLYLQKMSDLNPNIDTATMFYVPSPTPLQEVFQGENYNTYIALSKKYDVACVPVYPILNDDFKLGVAKPYIAFISAANTNTDRNNKFVKETNTEWSIDLSNSTYGSALGYDPSFIRNPAVAMFNPHTSQEPDAVSNTGDNNYGQGVFLGANNISFDFNSTFDRFTFSNLSSPMTIGQGTVADIEYGNGIVKDSEDSPEQVVFNTSLLGQYPNTVIRSDNTTFKSGWKIKQKFDTFIDSYSGLSLLTIQLYFKNGITQEYNLFDTENNESVIKNSLLGKLGFKFSDLLPKIGNPQARLSENDTDNTYSKEYQQLSPITSGLYISSSEYQATATNVLNQPTFDISYNLGKQTRPDAQPSLVVATNLPSKLDYPFLTIHSSLPSMGTNTLYYGSRYSYQKIPVMGYVPRYNNQGNFFYGLESSFNFTAMKDFVLTDIDTRVLLPNGSRPRLNVNSSVIYKITKIEEPLEEEDNSKSNSK